MTELRDPPLTPLVKELLDLNETDRADFLGDLGRSDAQALLYDWTIWARPDQIPPDSGWFVWMLLGGRGVGKTRTGSEFVRQEVGETTDPAIRVALIGETAADVRDVIVEGDSGILACSPPDNMPLYEPSKRRLTWPNGSVGTCYSGDKPGQLRGPQHHLAWVDELAKMRYPQETFDMLEYGLRLGSKPRVIVTTTPKPIPIIRRLRDDPGCHLTHSITYDNLANLSDKFIRRIIQQHEGTRLARQELYAEILEDMPGALWHHTNLEEFRVFEHPPLLRIVVAIDPQANDMDMESGTYDAEAGLSETGIVVAGLGEDRHVYVLADGSGYHSPDNWAKRLMKLYRVWKADCIVAEVNHGGAMVSSLIRTKDDRFNIKEVRASRGKYRRAEPVAALYEQGRCHHVGTFGDLEDQLCTFDPIDEEAKRTHPDRLDALVWAVHDLLVEDDPDTSKFEHYDQNRHTRVRTRRRAA